MVFARSKLMLEDVCFAEEPGSLEMKLVGPNVTKVYDKMYELMKAVFNVTDADIQESVSNWGKTDKGEKFKVRWWLHKDMDIFSYIFIRFDLSGETDGKSGTATIKARGLLRSEYPQDTLWQRSLFYEVLRTFWHKSFYHRKKEEYAEECRHSMSFFQKKLKEMYDRLKEKGEKK
jgi:hypothetical protein